MNDEEEIDRQDWEDILSTLIDLAAVILLFVVVGIVCFAWGFYG